MNHDEKFKQRWEFRRKEVDGDSSSDDNQSNSNGEPAKKKRNLVTDLVLLENDEPSDNPECQAHDKQNVETAEKKTKAKAKSGKKKNVVQKKSKSKGCAVEKNKRKRNFKTDEMVTFKDLKMFSDSLIHELTVSRENMFAHMREEMRKMVSKKEPVKKNVKRRSQKNKAPRQKGVEAGVKSQNCPGGSKDKNVKKTNVAPKPRKSSKTVVEPVKNDQVLEVTTTKELHKEDGLRVSSMAQINLPNGSDQIVSSSYLTLPTVLQKPQLQNIRNHMRWSDHIPQVVPINNTNSERDIGKSVGDQDNYQRFGNFSHISHKTVAFPVPLSQGTESGSNISSLTYCENSFVDNNKMGSRMNGVVRFPMGNPALSEQIFPYFVNNNAPRDGEFVSVKPQELKDGQFYLTSLRNLQQ